MNIPSKYPGDIPTPWGYSHTKERVKRGVIYVTTGSHGGYMIAAGVARRELSRMALTVGFRWRASRNGQLYYCFEEDCDWAVVVFEHPEWRDEYQKSRGDADCARAEARSSLLRWRPEYLPAYQRGAAGVMEPTQIGVNP